MIESYTVQCRTPLEIIMNSSNRIADQFSDTYIQAREARSLAVSLENNPKDLEASKQWHLIADSLFEAVELFDKMTTQGNRLPSQWTKQKTM